MIKPVTIEDLRLVGKEVNDGEDALNRAHMDYYVARRFFDILWKEYLTANPGSSMIRSTFLQSLRE